MACLCSGNSLPGSLYFNTASCRKMLQFLPQHSLQYPVCLHTRTMSCVQLINGILQYLLPNAFYFSLAASHRVQYGQTNQMKSTQHSLDPNSWKSLGDRIDHIQDATMRTTSEDHQSFFLLDHHYQFVLKPVQFACAALLCKKVPIAFGQRIWFFLWPQNSVGFGHLLSLGE